VTIQTSYFDHMTKRLLILVFTITSLCAFAQTYTIPGATQQPAWVFPIYFEEGTGLKDTIYLGYDPNASPIHGPFPGSIDTVFGEDYELIDTSKFKVFWTSCCDAIHDTVIRVDVAPSGYLGGSIFFTKGVLPLTVKWDKSLFYSAILPYPDQSPAPYAEGNSVHRIIIH